LSREGWCTPVILALGRQRQENAKFKVIFGYIFRTCLKKGKRY
jgi:hypothetical protein